MVELVAASQADSYLALATAGDLNDVPEETLLNMIVSSPAPRLLHHAPSIFDSRTYELLRDAISAHADAELDFSKHPGAESEERANYYSQRLWALMPVLLAIPLDFQRNGQGDDAQLHTKFELVELVRKRLQIAETGRWKEIYKEYIGIRDHHQEQMLRDLSSQALADVGGEEWIFANIGRKIRSSGLSPATSMLLGQVSTAQDESTANQMCDLMAPPIPASEEANLQAAMERLSREPLKPRLPKSGLVRRRLSLLNTAAEPGPSGLRNHTLVGVRGVSGGVQALQKWCSMWCSGRVTTFTTSLWTAGLGIPVDCGAREEEYTGRKLRPITLLEALPKFAEAVGLDEGAEEIRKVFEPDQLGVNTPDGNIILLRTLQAWASDIEQANVERFEHERWDELEAMAALDLKNAYGNFYRSGAVNEV